MSARIFDLPKIDGHCHVFDPDRFPFAAEVPYHPRGQEVGTAAYFSHVMEAYGVRHALLVGPNSGYGCDNRCMLDAIAQGRGRFKGVAVVATDTSLDALAELKAKGIIGIAFNAALHGLPYYDDIGPLLAHLEALDMWAQFQVCGDQLVELLPRIERGAFKLMIDHCGRPVLDDGLAAPGVQALAELGRSERCVVKLSGFSKFSQAGYPFDDARAHVELLMRAFGPQRCIWASDWPYLRAETRLDYGTLLSLAERWFTPQECRQMMWDAPSRLFGW